MLKPYILVCVHHTYVTLARQISNFGNNLVIHVIASLFRMLLNAYVPSNVITDSQKEGVFFMHRPRNRQRLYFRHRRSIFSVDVVYNVLYNQCQTLYVVYRYWQPRSKPSGPGNHIAVLDSDMRCQSTSVASVRKQRHRYLATLISRATPQARTGVLSNLFI